MLSQNLSDIICFIKGKGINPAEPSPQLLARLEELNGLTKAGFMVYDFEKDSLYFANTTAYNVLGIPTGSASKFDGEFLEHVMHPVSYQLLHLNTKFRAQQQEVGGLYYLKTAGKGKYTWIHGLMRILNLNTAGLPRLIYVSFFEVDKAIDCYTKMLHSSPASVTAKEPSEVLDTLKPREIEILTMIADECISKEISDKLNISQVAVDAARKRLIKKLGVKSVAGLVKIAVSLGLTQTSSGGEPAIRIVKRSKNTGLDDSNKARNLQHADLLALQINRSKTTRV